MGIVIVESNEPPRSSDSYTVDITTWVKISQQVHIW